jgi:hypothetical protein
VAVRPVDDILSQGGDREPNPWPRRLAVLAVLVVLAVLITRYFPGSGHDRGHRPAAAATAGLGPLAGPPALPPPVLVPGPDSPGGPDGPAGIAGPVSRWGIGLRLPAGGDQPTWYWPASGRQALIGGLPLDRSGYRFTRVGGGWAVQPDAGGQPGCGYCAGLPLPVYFLPDGSGSATRVGSASTVAPGSTPGTMWLTSYPPRAYPGMRGATARQVSDAGAAEGAGVSLPAGYVIDRATLGGLLLAPVAQPAGSAAFVLWNPASGRISRTFDEVIAASPSEVAWSPPCVRVCMVRVVNLATGRLHDVRLLAGRSATNGAFSPDGRFLALQLSSGSGGDGGAIAMQLAVAAMPGSMLADVPGTWASSDALVAFGWPAGSDSLVTELNFMTKVQLASWQPGATRPAVAVVGPDQDPAALIIGS